MIFGASLIEPFPNSQLCNSQTLTRENEIFKAAHSCLAACHPDTVRGGIPAVSSSSTSPWCMKDFQLLVIAFSFVHLCLLCPEGWAGHSFPHSFDKVSLCPQCSGLPQLVWIPAALACSLILRFCVDLSPSGGHCMGDTAQGQAAHSVLTSASNCCPRNHTLFCSTTLQLLFSLFSRHGSVSSMQHAQF